MKISPLICDTYDIFLYIPFVFFFFFNLNFYFFNTQWLVYERYLVEGKQIEILIISRSAKTNCLSVLTCIFPTFSQYIIFSISIQSRSFDKMLKFSIMPFSVSKVGCFLKIKQTQLYSIEEIKECWGCQDWKENYVNNWYIHFK